MQSPVERVTLVLVAAATWLFRGDPHLRRSVASTVLGMLVGRLVAVAPTMLVAGIVIARSIALRQGPTTDPADSMGAP